jgi:hypothetical protein
MTMKLDRELTRSEEALLYAHERGYYVAEDGTLYGPRGVRKPKFRCKHGVPYQLFSVRIKRDGEWVSANVDVHRLQALQKFGVKQLLDKRLQVRHLDGDSTNNAYENIGIGTKSQNECDKSKEVRQRTANTAASHRRLLNDDDVRRLRKLRAEGWKLVDLSEEFGISKGNVSMIVNRHIYKEVS